MVDRTINKNTSLVSVVLPCCNDSPYIEQAMRSVLLQSYESIELIVIDDASTDRTVEKIKSIQVEDDRVRLICLNENSGGPAKPRNIGLREAQGDYIAFIDADDIWHPQKLALQINAMVRNQLNFSSTFHIRFSGEFVVPDGSKLSVETKISQINHLQLLKKNIIVASGVVLSSNLAKKVRFSEEKKFIAIEDYLAWLYLHQEPSLNSAIIQQPLVFYRLRNDSISSSKTNMAKKIFLLLCHYKVDGKNLGIIKYYYFTTYVWGALKARYIN